MQKIFLHSYTRWMWLAIAYISVMLLLDIAGGDLWLATKLYQLRQQWLLKEYWLTSGVLHKGARIVVLHEELQGLDWDTHGDVSHSVAGLI